MIFYFSAEGDSRWVAMNLASVLQDQLVSIPDVLGKEEHFHLERGERLGFAFPVHGWRPPLIVREFLKSLCIESEEKPFTYAVCTAGDTVGLTIEDLGKAIVSNKSMAALHVHQVDSAYSILMPETYVGLPFMDIDTKEKENKKKTEAKEMLKRIGEEIAEKKTGIFRLHKGHWPWINSQILGSLFEKILITDKPFRVISDRCIKCGICAQVCPTADIIGGKGQEPVWRHNGSCLSCFNCYHHCPRHAIEYGSRTKHKGQYFFKSF
ncbi:MAG: EFR1 family ferrodoxin [Prevotella sp.]|jgi:NAD-dependent dihydropyrimidine dehydrogenase PreA subunit|nr:EFR1 family ferrodoxin [uncultured Prevotella sp.]MCI1247149.1 EFR1 family ferrodoxin [Prevotella sp.]